ncbi:hypothetical protein H7J87_12280 [Mycolicibacterium wolinskyi]|uniref:hypothetical protein n=1 Tax=Mycolicibacterium TaxID=1866885 RepID=UPI0013FD255B|nr:MULTISPECIES: hypothetical protein [Mycolicibacterium]MCV7286107.1 hypothetical protein [Mycolicibacterium wolinskyi]MCV7296303.1 hypothetical protein [Mycolicibacterium goodii]
MNRTAMTRQAASITPANAVRLAITVMAAQLAMIVGVGVAAATVEAALPADRDAGILYR